MRGRKTLVAAAVGAVTIATGSAAFATASVEATRLAGDDRYETSRVVADATFGDQTTVAVLASGATFPDALAASYLAGAADAPVVLTEPGRLTPAAEDALEAIGAAGVLVVGGPRAVSDDVLDQVAALGYEVQRIAGGNRYSTARAIAESVPEEQIGSLEGDVGRTALLASGQGFADALSGGPLAYDFGFPLLLTPRTSLSADAQAAIQNLDIEQVVILGGSAAVSPAVEAAVTGLGVDVRRVEGLDRTLTATAIADLAVDELGFSTSHVNIARGDGFADALSGAGNAGQERAPILLTLTPTQLGAAATGWLQQNASTLASIHVYGGRSAVSDATLNAAEVAAGRTP